MKMGQRRKGKRQQQQVKKIFSFNEARRVKCLVKKEEVRRKGIDTSRLYFITSSSEVIH
jgi:hypothetical protein